MVEERWNEQDRCANIAMKQTGRGLYHGWPTLSIDATAAFMESFAGYLYSMHTCYYKMESKTKRLKRHEDRVFAGGEGNVTACLVVPLLEEQIPGTETCSYEGFEFTAALFLS